MKKLLLFSLALVISGCASMEVAHYSLNDRLFPAQINPDKKIYFSIDEKYLDSKAIIHYGLRYDEVALKNERNNFRSQFIGKIKKSPDFPL